MSGVQDPLAFLGGPYRALDDRDETLRNIRLIIRIRWFVSPSVLLLLLVASAAGLSRQQAFSVDQLVVNAFNTVSVLGLNLLYTRLARRVRDVRPLIYLQLFVDILSFSVTVYKTGGAVSPLTFLYFGAIFAAALLVSGRAAFLTAAFSAGAFTLLMALESGGGHPAPGLLPRPERAAQQRRLPAAHLAGHRGLAVRHGPAGRLPDPGDPPQARAAAGGKRRAGPQDPDPVAPLVVRDKLIGVVGIDRGTQNGWITEDEFQVLLIFANQAAITLSSLLNDPAQPREIDPVL